MAQLTTDSERITAFREPGQQLQTPVSDSIFRIVASNNHQAAVVEALQNSHKLVIAGKTFFPFSFRRAFVAAPLSASISALTVTPPPSKRAVAQAAAVVDRISGTARRALRMTAILLAPVAIVFCSIAHAWAAPTVHFSGAELPIGSGLSVPYGVAVDGSGNVYIADSGNDQVLKETLGSAGYTQSVVASATLGGLSNPVGVAVDGSGNVYIADSANNQVLKETLGSTGYTQSVVASATPGGLHDPSGVAVNGSGTDVYIADTLNNRVLKETLSGGLYAQSVVTSSTLNQLHGVAVDGSGNVYIADSGNNRVLKETLAGSTYTETVVATTGLSYPEGVALNGSDVYIADSGNDRVLKETPAGSTYTPSNLISSNLDQPDGVAVDGSGNLYIADTFHNQVVQLQPSIANFGPVVLGSTSAGAVAIALIFTFETGAQSSQPC